MTAVADGVIVYASDPTPTAGELVFDFVAGQTRLVLAGPPEGTNAAATVATAAGAANAATVTTHAQTFGLTTDGLLTQALDPAVTNTTALTHDFISGSTTLALPYDSAAATRATAGVAASAGTANDTSASTAASADAAAGASSADTSATGRTPEHAASSVAALDATTTVAIVVGAVTAVGVAETPSFTAAIPATAATSSGTAWPASILTDVEEDVHARTVTVYDHGHTVTIKRST